MRYETVIARLLTGDPVLQSAKMGSETPEYRATRSPGRRGAPARRAGGDGLLWRDAVAQSTPGRPILVGMPTPMLIHLIFLSPDFISISIGFPYRSMGLLY
jgi:hypothetical protein